MTTLPTSSVVIERNGLTSLGRHLAKRVATRRAVIVCDTGVPNIFVRKAAQSLRRSGFSPIVYGIRFHESKKNLATVAKLYSMFGAGKVERTTPIVALGGGVTGDTVGFASATYLRGLPFVQCPTTLLAMVDSSLGGKVGVNLSSGKNLVGTFVAPKLILVDPTLVTTLPARELRNGLGECIKHAVLMGDQEFSWIEHHAAAIENMDEKVLLRFIKANVQYKLEVTKRDPYERGERAFLNLGHTFGHAIEKAMGYGVVPHGEAVGLGLVAALEASVLTDRCKRNVVDRVTALLQQFEMPTRVQLPRIEKLMAAMRGDKKTEKGAIRFVLLRGLGKPELADDVSARVLKKAWRRIGARAE